MKKYRITMYAPDREKFHFTVTAENREEAQKTALRRMIIINIEEIKEE